jgi:hypothetical protein
MQLGNQGATRSLFGDVALFVFLLTQAGDGVLTYIGVRAYGLHVEGNPVLSWLMLSIGQVPALAAAKVMASSFGVVLHMSAVHRAVAALAGFYIAVAIVPWLAILLFS